MNLEIIFNSYTGGESTVFQKGEKWFYADRSPVPGIGLETMIFPYDKDSEEVTSWIELYCDRSGQSLEECVKEFLLEE